MRRARIFTTVIAGAALWAAALLPLRAHPRQPSGGTSSPDSSQNSLAVEALSRLEGIDLERNPAVKKAVLRVLASTRGTPQFVEIVKKFDLKDQDEGLLEAARLSPESDAGVEAMRMILARGNTELLKTALKSTNNVEAGKILEAMGNAKEKRIVPLALAVLKDEKRDAGVRRQAIRALAQTEEGSEEALQLARQFKLGPEVMFAAASALNAVRWPAVKAEAARLMPLPQGRNQQSLPPVAELLKMKGDPANGAKVMARPETGCFNCHSVKGHGAQIGPDLSEIGTKLGKDALCEAILDPSAGIAFGYEAWQIQLKSGDEAYGLVVSDTADEMSVKDLKGIVTRYKKSEIAGKEQLKTSIMPNGLQQSMTTREFVDLVEYLSTLKKPAE
jgi:putative heme-binding domain-containing protein